MCLESKYVARRDRTYIFQLAGEIFKPILMRDKIMSNMIFVMYNITMMPPIYTLKQWASRQTGDVISQPYVDFINKYLVSNDKTNENNI